MTSFTEQSTLSRPRTALARRGGAPGALLALLLVGLGLGGRAAAGPGPVLSPTSAPGIRALVRPHALGDAVSDGWRLGDLAISPDRAVFHLRGPASGGSELSGAMILRARGAAKGLRSAHFTIRFEGPLPLGLRTHLYGRVLTNDRESPWSGGEPDQAPTARPSVLPLGPTALLAGALLLLILLSLGSMPRLAEALRMDRPTALALAALVLLSWWLRAGWAEFLPADVNTHAYETLMELKAPRGDSYLTYGNGYRALFALLSPLSSGAEVTEATVGRVNAICGALSVGALFCFLQLLLNRTSASMIAAGLLGALPAHIRLSASESRFVLATLLCLWGAVLLLSWLKTARARFALGAALCFGVGVQVRPEMALVMAASGLLLFTHPPPWCRRTGLHVLAALAVLALISGEWLLLVSRQLLGAEGAQGAAEGVSVARMLDVPAMLGLGGREHATAAFLDARFTPWFLPALGILGAGGLFLGRRVGAALALAGLAWAGMAAGLAFDHGANNLRLQLLSMPFWVSLSAVGLDTLAGLASRGIRAAEPAPGAWALGLLAAGGLLTTQGELARHRFTPQAEYAFQKAQIPRLPRHCRIFYPASQNKHPSHPPAYLSDEAGRAHSWEQVQPGERRSYGEKGACRLYYRPSACFTVNDLGPGELAGGMQRGCSRIEKRLRLTPVATTSLAADPYHLERYGRSRLEIGFFRFEEIEAPRLR